MSCERNRLVPLGHGFTSTSSIVTVMLMLPLIPRYKPVPEPDTTGVAAVTLKWNEQVGVDGQWLVTLTIFLSRLAMLSRNEPFFSPSLSSLVCSGSTVPFGWTVTAGP